jgi:hypothetical protein
MLLAPLKNKLPLPVGPPFDVYVGRLPENDCPVILRVDTDAKEGLYVSAKNLGHTVFEYTGNMRFG